MKDTFSGLLKKVEKHPLLTLILGVLGTIGGIVTGFFTDLIKEYLENEFKSPSEKFPIILLISECCIILVLCGLCAYVVIQALAIFKTTLMGAIAGVQTTENKEDARLNNIDKKLETMQEDLSKRLAIKTTFVSNFLSEKDEAYITSLESIKNAHRSIKIIGDFSPKDFSLDSTNERLNYLKEIENKIQSHIEKSLPFNYTRIMQRDSKTYNEIRRRDKRVLYEDEMNGSEHELAHCKRVLDLKKEAQRKKVDIGIHILVARSLPNCPSMLMIDGAKKNYVLFTMPILHDEKPDLNYSTAGVLFFELWRSDLEYFNKLIEVFEHRGKEILSIASRHS